MICCLVLSSHITDRARAFVTLGDIDVVTAKAVVEELGTNATAVVCDVREWKDQLHLFKTAFESSPSQSIDIVIANAGLGGAGDAMMVEEGWCVSLLFSILIVLTYKKTQIRNLKSLRFRQ